MRQPTRSKATPQSSVTVDHTPRPPFEALAQPSRPQHLPRKRQALGWHTCLVLRPSTCADDVTRMIPGVLVPLDEISVGVKDAGPAAADVGSLTCFRPIPPRSPTVGSALRERRKLRRGSLALRLSYITHCLGGIAHLGWVWIHAGRGLDALGLEIRGGVRVLVVGVRERWVGLDDHLLERACRRARAARTARCWSPT